MVENKKPTGKAFMARTTTKDEGRLEPGTVRAGVYMVLFASRGPAKSETPYHFLPILPFLVPHMQ